MKYSLGNVVYYLDPAFYAVHKVRIKGYSKKMYQLANGPDEWARETDLFANSQMAHDARQRRIKHYIPSHRYSLSNDWAKTHPPAGLLHKA